MNIEYPIKGNHCDINGGALCLCEKRDTPLGKEVSVAP